MLFLNEQLEWEIYSMLLQIYFNRFDCCFNKNVAIQKIKILSNFRKLI